MTIPPSIFVPANGSATFDMTLKVNASKLPVWTLNGGTRGGDGFRLQGVEVDGYLRIARRRIASRWCGRSCHIAPLP